MALITVGHLSAFEIHLRVQFVTHIHKGGLEIKEH